MSWKKYIIAILVTIALGGMLILVNLPIDNNVLFLGLCMLGHAYILYQEN